MNQARAAGESLAGAVAVSPVSQSGTGRQHVAPGVSPGKKSGAKRKSPRRGRQKFRHGRNPGESRSQQPENHYASFTLSESKWREVAAYIDRQAEHHSEVPFPQEWKLLLEKHGVEFDARHYLH